MPFHRLATLGILKIGRLFAFGLLMVSFVTWLGLVFEAIVAIPLRAFAHLSIQNGGLRVRGFQGYSILLNVLVAPALTLIVVFLGLFLFSHY